MSQNISIWTALADDKRRQILNLLAEKPHTTSELLTFFDVSRFAIMKHLKVLEQANLITVRREGRRRWNSLRAEVATQLRALTNSDGRGGQPGSILEGRLDLAGKARPEAPAGSIGIEQTFALRAQPRAVFAALTVEIDAWWSERLRAASTMRLEPYVNGRFYEAFGADGDGMLYGTVTGISQDKMLHLNGTLGLTNEMMAGHLRDTVLQITIQPVAVGSEIRLQQRIYGASESRLASVYKKRWDMLIGENLKQHVEEGAVPSTGRSS